MSKITHRLNNNFSYYLNCPICGANFIEINQQKKLQDFKKKINKNKILKFDRKEINEIERIKRFIFHCSNCSFNVEYILDLNKSIKR